MGIDIELFVYPDRISEELICPICHSVVENPVQTPSEHLFCEDELLEWLVQSTICPVTNTPIDASAIKPPGRLISNMLSSLVRYCPNKDKGCQWTGKSEQVERHCETCSKTSNVSAELEMKEKDTLISSLKEELAVSLSECSLLETENVHLKDENEKLKKKVQVYDAFFNHGDNSEGMADEKVASLPKSDASHLARLRRYEEKSIYL